MCGRFEQSETRLHYARALLPDAPEYKWGGGDTLPQYNISPGRPVLALQMLKGQFDSDRLTWGYRTPQENRKPWINARIEKALSGRYFRHMFREGRVIIPGGGWFEWTVEDGKKQPWYITRRNGQPIFMAGITNLKSFARQAVEVGTVIVTEDCDGGMVDIHDRRPVVLEPDDALRWLDMETSVEEAAHIAQLRSIPTEEFMWWKVDRVVNRSDPSNSGKHLLAPMSESR